MAGRGRSRRWRATLNPTTGPRPRRGSAPARPGTPARTRRPRRGSDLGQRPLAHPAAAAGRPPQRLVVDQDRDAVRGQHDVELDPAGAQLVRLPQAGQRVLRRLGSGAAVPDHAPSPAAQPPAPGDQGRQPFSSRIAASAATVRADARGLSMAGLVRQGRARRRSGSTDATSGGGARPRPARAAERPAAPAAGRRGRPRAVRAAGNRLPACCGYGLSASATSWSSSARCRRRAGRADPRRGRLVQRPGMGSAVSGRLGQRRGARERGRPGRLGSGRIKGVGEEPARRLVERFGVGLGEVIEREPARLREVEGVGAKLAARLQEIWQGHRRPATRSCSWPSRGSPRPGPHGSWRSTARTRSRP